MKITAKNGMIIETNEANVIGFETSFYDHTINRVVTSYFTFDVMPEELTNVKLKLRNHARNNRMQTTNGNSKKDRTKTIHINSV